MPTCLPLPLHNWCMQYVTRGAGGCKCPSARRFLSNLFRRLDQFFNNFLYLGARDSFCPVLPRGAEFVLISVGGPAPVHLIVEKIDNLINLIDNSFALCNQLYLLKFNFIVIV